MKHIVYIWWPIFAVVVTSTLGDVLQAHAMWRIGDFGELYKSRGLFYVIRRVLTSGSFMLGLFFMALAFFALLVALSRAPVSLVGPATASMTFITNAIAAKFFLKENVNRRRAAAAILVACGVVLLAH